MGRRATKHEKYDKQQQEKYDEGDGDVCGKDERDCDSLPSLPTSLVIASDQRDAGYGYVEKCFGDCRFNLVCDDIVERIGVLRGSLKKRVRVQPGAMVVYDKQCFLQNSHNKVEIVHVYTDAEVQLLNQMNELPLTLYNLYSNGMIDYDLACLSSANIENDVEFSDF
jgi:initiation factor 1A